jgi:thioredoxin 1
MIPYFQSKCVLPGMFSILVAVGGSEMRAPAQGAMDSPGRGAALVEKTPADAAQRKAMELFLEGLQEFDSSKLDALDIGELRAVLNLGWKGKPTELPANLSEQGPAMIKVASALFQPGFTLPDLDPTATPPFLKLVKIGNACLLAAEIQLAEKKPEEAARWTAIGLRLGSTLAQSGVNNEACFAAGSSIHSFASFTAARLLNSGVMDRAALTLLEKHLIECDAIIAPLKGPLATGDPDLRNKRGLAYMRINLATVLRLQGFTQKATNLPDPFTGKPLLFSGRHYYSAGPDGDDDGLRVPVSGDIKSDSNGDLFFPMIVGSGGATASVLRPQSSDAFRRLFGQSTSKPAVVKFYADWCGPCKVYAPVFDAASARGTTDVNYISINIDKAQDVARSYGVQSIPATIAVDRNGKVRQRAEGIIPAEVIGKLATIAAQ